VNVTIEGVATKIAVISLALQTENIMQTDLL